MIDLFKEHNKLEDLIREKLKGTLYDTYKLKPFCQVKYIEDNGESHYGIVTDLTLMNGYKDVMYEGSWEMIHVPIHENKNMMLELTDDNYEVIGCPITINEVILALGSKYSVNSNGISCDSKHICGWDFSGDIINQDIEIVKILYKIINES